MCYTSPELRSASSYGHFTAAKEFRSQWQILSLCIMAMVSVPGGKFTAQGIKFIPAVNLPPAEGRPLGRPPTTQNFFWRLVSSSSCKRLLNVLTSIRFAFLTPLRYTHRPETSPDVNLKGSALPSDPKIKEKCPTRFFENMTFLKVPGQTDIRFEIYAKFPIRFNV